MSSSAIPADRGINQGVPQARPVNYARLCITIISLLAIILGSLSVAEVGVLRHVGAWGWFMVGGGVIGQLVNYATFVCQQFSALGTIKWNIASTVLKSMEPKTLIDKRRQTHLYSRVFLFLQPKNGDIGTVRDFMITNPIQIREELNEKLASLDSYNLELYDTEFVCITKLQYPGIATPAYDVNHGDGWSSYCASTLADLKTYLTGEIFKSELRLFSDYQFPIETLT